MTRLKLIVLIAVLAAAAVGLWMLLDEPAAHADPDPSLVCGMYDAGVPPAQIPGDLRRNNPRVNSPTLPYQVFQDLQDCP